MCLTAMDSFLESISDSALYLSDAVSTERDLSIVKKLTIRMLELEQNTSDLISDISLKGNVRLCRMKFICANCAVVKRLEKIQLQSGSDFDELLTALKLESKTLNEELV